MLKRAPYTPDEIEEVPCPVCGASKTRVMYEEQALQAGRCLGCGLVYTNRRSRMAQSHFWEDVETIRDGWQWEIADPTTHTRYRSFLRICRRLREIHPAGNLLEIGCFCGFFLHAARATAPWRLFGVEPGPGAARICKGLLGDAVEVHNGFVHDAPWPDNTFDCIVFNDVFEHIPDPNEFLVRVRRLLKPDGVLFLKTPNERWVTAKNFVARKVLRLRSLDNFPLTTIREHVTHWSQDTLEAVMRRNELRVRRWVIDPPIHDRFSYSRKLWKRAIRYSLFLLGAGVYSASGRIAWPVMHLSAVVEHAPVTDGG